MTAKKTKKPKHADPGQHKRFVETAEKLGADNDAGALDRALKKVVTSKKAASP
jgi:hypothetical protein